MHILAIGKLASRDPKSVLIDDYQKRIEQTGRQLGLRSCNIKAFEAARGLSGMAAQTQESKTLLAALPHEAVLIGLDERGKSISSEEFAASLGKWRDSGRAHLAFVIGGADGHTEALRQRCEQLWAFGRATWPHMMARVMLCEQLYRSLTILAGHPYHRAG